MLDSGIRKPVRDLLRCPRKPLPKADPRRRPRPLSQPNWHRASEVFNADRHVKDPVLGNGCAGLECRGVPPSFQTTSTVAIIGNQWKSSNKDVEALEDLGHIVFFEPSALEVHLNAGGWFWDQEIFDFVGPHLHLVEKPSLRTYVLASERKRAGLGWQTAVLGR